MRTREVLLRIAYWIAVLAVSIVLLVLLVRFFESRDESQVEGARLPLERDVGCRLRV